MNESNVLNTLRLPARLDVESTAKLLGLHAHDIAVLVRSKLLKPLGNPAANAPKYFASLDIQQKASDVPWLAKASNAIAEHWRHKNQKRREDSVSSV
jgi:hypothetical protein